MYTRQLLTGYLVKRLCPTSVNYKAEICLQQQALCLTAGRVCSN